MKNFVLISFALVLVLCLTAVAQDSASQGAMSQQAPATEKALAKAVTLSGKISDDGKSFTSDQDSKNLTITNPEAVKGHEGHEVKIKGHENTATNELHVVSVKMKSEKKQTMKKDETQKY